MQWPLICSDSHVHISLTNKPIHVSHSIQVSRREGKMLKKCLKSKLKVTQSCLTLCDPMDYTVHGIPQARILEWVAYPFSSRSSWPRNQTGVSCIAGGFFTNWAIREALKKKKKKKLKNTILSSHYSWFKKEEKQTESKYFQLALKCFWKSTAELKNTEGFVHIFFPPTFKELALFLR